MNARELRIGNKLIRPNGNIATVNWGVIKDVEAGDRTYQPIPLTDYWLLRFEFEKSGSGQWLLPNRIFSLRKITKKSFLSDELLDNPFFRMSPSTDIYFVHQLQNLYFALTREELPE